MTNTATLNTELAAALAQVRDGRAASDKIYAVLAGLVSALDQLGFHEEHSPVNGGDCVETIGQHIGALRSATRLARSAGGYYLVGHWGHIFAGSPSERTTRLVFDRHERQIVAMQIKTATGYQDAGRRQIADVLDSILTANAEALTSPEEWGLAIANSLPSWACRGEKSEAIQQFEREIADCKVQFGLLIGELAGLVDGADLETESEFRWDVVDEVKTHVGAAAANAEVSALRLPGCIPDSSEDDEDSAIAAAEEWVAQNISNGDTQTLIAAAIALSSANETEERVRQLVPAPSNAPV